MTKKVRGFSVLLGTMIILTLPYLGLDAQVQGPPSPVEVKVRIGEGPEGKRIVFEGSDEAFIKGTSASVSKDSIQVRFPSAPVLRYSHSINLDLSLQGSILNIRFKEPFKIKTLYLPSPPRFSIDVLKTSEEILTPKQKETRPSAIAVSSIIIDPGHGGYDSGIIRDGIREKDLTLSIAKEMESILLKKKRPVFLTRRVDQFLSITDRAIAANQKVPGLFISLHLSLSNGFVINIPHIDTDVVTDNSFDMIYRQRSYVDKSKALAEALGKAIREEFKQEVTYREIPLPLLNSIGCPAILIELPGGTENDKETRAKLARTILKGIDYVVW